MVKRINIKPLSANVLWQGRRFKTEQYKKYRRDLNLLLPANMLIPEGPLYLWIIFRISNMQADVDNFAKGFIDGLQDKYGFDDSRIVELHLRKERVAKGEEHIKFIIMGK